LVSKLTAEAEVGGGSGRDEFSAITSPAKERTVNPMMKINRICIAGLLSIVSKTVCMD
jgi:hypothetical protein